MKTTTPGHGGLPPASASGPGRRSDAVTSMTSISLAVDVIRWDSDVDRLSADGCPDCRAALMLHQPDEATPELLLAACRGCQVWLLIDIAEGIMVRLPDRQALRDARSASGSRDA